MTKHCPQIWLVIKSLNILSTKNTYKSRKKIFYFELRKLNVISFIVSTLGEAGIKNIYPVLKGTFEYVGDMNDFARDVLKYSSQEQKEGII